MPFIFTPTGGGGANQNLDNTYESLGKGANGDGVLLTSNVTAHVKGSYVSIGTPSADLAGFTLHLGPASASANRYLLDVRINGTTIIVPDLYMQPGVSVGWRSMFIPINVPSGQAIEARIQASGGGGTMRIWIEGVHRNAQSAPLFTSMTALMVDSSSPNTRAGTVAIPWTNAWTELLASAGASYPAFLATAGLTSVNPTGLQSMTVEIGTGGSGAEVHLTDFPMVSYSTDPRIPTAMSRVVEKTLPNARVAARILATTPGTDASFIGLYGLNL